MPEPTASPAEFIRADERTTNSHDVTQLVPLIHSEAVHWFTDGSHHGRDAVLSTIAETFAAIRDNAGMGNRPADRLRNRDGGRAAAHEAVARSGRFDRCASANSGA
ncbi:hypothetical protein ACIQVK_41400 [Streptomyces sp. NPDC090493]|uniref:hypothetical protein n=1 Tax=Streptomyces sp. NPDC090493 TaxID=3365964 RepID=UPI00381BED54